MEFTLTCSHSVFLRFYDNNLIFLRKFGEPTGVRTLDLLIKSQLLYQLSYRLSPISGARRGFVCRSIASVACVYADSRDNARGNFDFFNRLAENILNWVVELGKTLSFPPFETFTEYKIDCLKPIGRNIEK